MTFRKVFWSVAILGTVAVLALQAKAAKDCKDRGGLYVWRIYSCVEKGFFK